MTNRIIFDECWIRGFGRDRKCGNSSPKQLLSLIILTRFDTVQKPWLLNYNCYCVRSHSRSCRLRLTHPNKGSWHAPRKRFRIACRTQTSLWVGVLDHASRNQLKVIRGLDLNTSSGLVGCLLTPALNSRGISRFKFAFHKLRKRSSKPVSAGSVRSVP